MTGIHFPDFMKSTTKKDSALKKKAPAKKPRVRNPEQTRAKLLQATIDLLAEKGPDALSMKEAARLANVSRGVAYQHFADRDHLLREAKAWISDRLLESAKAIEPALIEKNIDRVLEESVNNVAKLVLHNREAARLLITEALAGKELDVDHPIYKMTVKGLEQLQTSGAARGDFDIEVLSFIMLGSIATMIMLSHLPNASGTDGLAQRFTLEWTRLLREGMFGNVAAKPAASKSKVATSPAPKKRALKPKARVRPAK